MNASDWGAETHVEVVQQQRDAQFAQAAQHIHQHIQRRPCVWNQAGLGRLEARLATPIDQ
jgi:hypothetical protein